MIPQPKTYGPFANLPLLDMEKPVQSMIKLANEYGPIYRFARPGGDTLMISSPELVADVCDESRFDKSVGGALTKVRAFTGDGLFTSDTEEPNWRKAHHILMPSFSQRAMRGYHDMMSDIALQLVQKWARQNPDEEVEVPEDMTRLTLDTIGLCGFNYRFNSFYRDQPHPFITSMVNALNESMNQLQRLGIQDKLMFRTRQQFRANIEYMNTVVDKLIMERREKGNQGYDDLLSHMLNSKDPETGEQLDDENIRYQIITFLIAGHETTSGMLSFAIYYLLKNPKKLQKAYAEVDQVLTGSVPTYKQSLNLKYVRMILNEALRLWPTAPAFSMFAKENTLLADRYPVHKGQRITVLLPKLHRDHGAWGEDVEAFRPERFVDSSKISQHAYKPFGNGQRACIGQQFAMHEATLILGMVLKHFELIDHTDYQLNIKETLTLKPEGLKMRVRLRHRVEIEASSSDEQIAVKAEQAVVKTKQISLEADSSVLLSQILQQHNFPLLVLYGSNLGTAEGLARELAHLAQERGFNSKVAPLKDYVGKLPKEGAVLILTSSYNGKPPANAKAFVQWIETAKPEEIEGVHYAILGCGDHNWAETYQHIPRFIDQQLSAKGALRLTPLGERDASGNFEHQEKQWIEQLWLDLLKGLGIDRRTGLKHMSIGNQQKEQLQRQGNQQVQEHVQEHLKIDIFQQDEDLPYNPPTLVERALQRYGLRRHDRIVIHAPVNSVPHLPQDQLLSAFDLLSYHVNLQAIVTPEQLRELASVTICPPHQVELQTLSQENNYISEVVWKQMTILDLLEKYEACQLPFERFIQILPELPRV